VLPAGIWEPAPGVGRQAASVAFGGGTLWWAYFRDVAGTVVVGAPHVVPRVGEQRAELVGLIHIGDEHYVAWVEGGGVKGRLYATEIDVSADERQRPDPRAADDYAPIPRSPFGRVTCTH
jgi:hypothetical protein